MPDPDWDELNRITEEAERLQGEGVLDAKVFKELLSQAEKASNGSPEYCESVMLFAPAGYDLNL